MGLVINGTPYDGGSITVSIIPAIGGPLNPLNQIPGAGKILQALGFKNIIGIEAISYGARVERTVVKGSGQVQRGFTPGLLYFNNGTMTIWQSELNSWVDQVGGLEGFCLHSDFDVTIQYRAQANVPLTKVELKGCRPVNVTSSHTFGSPENLTADVEFQITEIIFNGNKLLNGLNTALNIGNAIGNLL
jgi:hypothetical protein